MYTVVNGSLTTSALVHLFHLADGLFYHSSVDVFTLILWEHYNHNTIVGTKLNIPFQISEYKLI